MRRSRIVIVTLIAAALVALVVVIVKYGPLATTQSATSSPAGVGQSSTPSAVASSGWSATVTAAPSVTSGPASPAASKSPTAAATAAAPAPSATAGRHTVNVVITYLDWSATDGVVEAGAYATTVEEAGSCTLKLTSGGRSGTGSIAALTDASTMSCGGLRVPRDRLSSGTWTAVVIYESATSVGTSAPVEVVIP